MNKEDNIVNNQNQQSNTENYSTGTTTPLADQTIQPTDNIVGQQSSSQINNVQEDTGMPLPVPLDNIAIEQAEPNILEQTPLEPALPTTIMFPEPVQPVVEPPKNNVASKKKKVVPIILVVLILIVGGILVYFLILNKDKKSNDDNSNKNNKKEDNTPITSGYEWDSSSSIIVDVSNQDTIKLTCKTYNEYSDMRDESTVMYVFKDNVFLQAIVEEELIFNENSIKYYEYYLGIALEDMEEESGRYDNMISEIRKKAMSLSYVYSIDMTADPENPNNLLNSSNMTYDDGKQLLEKDGYVCE